ncbi:carbon-nitrogen hydrolase family protein [Clostridium transplantifaecale]|uniref:carbon-nitrogen hydrolase family protein n=1 Tax=Clostridium transplantifaecale TaxID=2479838 RepID=UPI000F641DA6|nr:carbon-nitrogen hydrolase family protein [Clostridium transplantifaecale]
MGTKLKLGLIQMDCILGDKQANLEKAETLIRNAAKQGAGMVCLPECFNTGYSAGGIRQMAEWAEPPEGNTVRRMQELAEELKIYLIAPLLLTTGPGICENSALLINDDGTLAGSYSKTHTIGDEKIYFRRGSRYPVFQTKYGKIGLLICYDMAFPEPARLLALQNAELILFPSAWRDRLNYRLMWENNLISRALDNVIFTAGINRAGVVDGVYFSGQSMVVDPRGSILQKADTGETVMIQEIDFEEILIERRVNLAMLDRHPQDYANLAKL